MSRQSKFALDQIIFERDSEVREWCQAHGVTEDELHNAVNEIQSFMATLELLVDRPQRYARTQTRASQARHGGKRATVIHRDCAAMTRRVRLRESAGQTGSRRGH